MRVRNGPSWVEQAGLSVCVFGAICPAQGGGYDQINRTQRALRLICLSFLYKMPSTLVNALSALFFDVSSPNYSLLALPAMYVITILPHWYSIALSMFYNGEWADENPRAFVTRLAARPILGDKKSQHTPLERKILRCQACQQNGFENMPIFGLALLCGILADLPGYLMNMMATLFILSRVLYTLAYVLSDSRSMSYVRTICFVGQVALYMRFFMQAAWAVAGRDQTHRWGF